MNISSQFGQIVSRLLTICPNYAWTEENIYPCIFAPSLQVVPSLLYLSLFNDQLDVAKW